MDGVEREDTKMTKTAATPAMFSELEAANRELREANRWLKSRLEYYKGGEKQDSAEIASLKRTYTEARS